MYLYYDLIIYILIFLLGGALASFYNASIYRIENDKKYPEILTENSYCEKCKRRLKWYELFPVFGYVYVRGRCRTCNFKISISYPISEALLGGTMVMLYYYDVDVKYFILLNLLFFLALYDFEYKGFPKIVMHLFLIITGVIFVYDFFFSFQRNIIVLILSLSIALTIAILNLVKRSFGTGDLLVILMISFVVTLSQFVAILFLSILLSGLFAIAILSLRKAGKKDTIPFVPFIFIAYVLIFPLHHYIQGYFASIIQLW